MRKAAAVSLLSAFLSACGGGGSDDAPTAVSPSPPAPVDPAPAPPPGTTPAPVPVPAPQPPATGTLQLSGAQLAQWLSFTTTRNAEDMLVARPAAAGDGSLEVGQNYTAPALAHASLPDPNSNRATRLARGHFVAATIHELSLSTVNGVALGNKAVLGMAPETAAHASRWRTPRDKDGLSILTLTRSKGAATIASDQVLTLNTDKVNQIAEWAAADQSAFVTLNVSPTASETGLCTMLVSVDVPGRVVCTNWTQNGGQWAFKDHLIIDFASHDTDAAATWRTTRGQTKSVEAGSESPGIDVQALTTQMNELRKSLQR